MRKLVISFISGLLLVGCSSSSAGVTPTPTIEVSSTPVAEPTPTIETNITPLTDEYINQMEGYELLRYGFLGWMDDEDGLREVINRADDFPGFAFVSELSEKDAVYGKEGEDYNVYLLVPKKGHMIEIGEYNWYAGEMTEVFYKSDSGKPILYIETSDNKTYHGQIRIDGDMTLYTGFNIATSKLRTEFKMGVVDITPYEEFTSSEVPFYAQALHDKMTQVKEIQKIEREGGSALLSGEEIIFEDTLYVLVYARDKDGKDIFYGVSPTTNKVIRTEDHQNWTIAE